MSIAEAEKEIDEKIKALCEKITSGKSDREFIEICYPDSKSSEGYGLFTFNLGIDIMKDYDLNMILINPAGKSDSSHTYLHIFLFKNKDDRDKFKDEMLKLHMELDEKVVQRFKESSSSKVEIKNYENHWSTEFVEGEKYV